MLTLPGRVFSMAQSGSRLVVATSGRQVLIYDLRACAPTLFTPDRACFAIIFIMHVYQVSDAFLLHCNSLEAGRPEQKRESSLKFQTRCVRCFPDATGYALSSVEGRVAMEYFDPSDSAQARLSPLGWLLLSA